MAIINFEKHFNPETIKTAQEALIQRVYFDNPQPFDNFLGRLETENPKELETLTTPLDKLNLNPEDLDISENTWLHYHNKSPLAILRSDIEMRKTIGVKPEIILDNSQNLPE